MTILALTTSTTVGGVAVIEGDRVLAEVTHGDPRGHAEHLFDLIDQALATAGRSRTDIRLVACDIGPGSFTGVRIGVASAKGIAVGLGVPLAGVLSLDAMAAQARAAQPDIALVAAAIDAKKDELYLALYDGERALIEPSHVPHGEAAGRVRDAVAARAFVSVVDVEAFAGFAPDAAVALVAPPSAAWIGRLAATRLSASGAAAAAFDAAEVVPLYVRAPDAIPTFAG